MAVMAVEAMAEEVMVVPTVSIAALMVRTIVAQTAATVEGR